MSEESNTKGKSVERKTVGLSSLEFPPGAPYFCASHLSVTRTMVTRTSEDIHYYSQRLVSAIRNLKESSVSDKNKEYIIRFVDSCFANSLSKARIVRYIQNLKQIALILGKDFDACQKADIMSVVSQLEMREYSEWTRHSYKVTLKRFFAWLNDCERGVYPDIVRWIRATVKVNKLTAPEILTREEIQRLVDSCENRRDRAFISVLADSGCRIGEVMGMRKRDVTFDEFGSVLMVKGKTGVRRVRLIESSKALSEWLEMLDSDSFVWINRKGDLMSHAYVRKILRILKTKTEIKKRLFPYVFRHTRATFLASHLTEAQMKVFFGWTQSSKMASYYVHLTGRDIDSSLIELSRANKVSVDTP